MGVELGKVLAKNILAQLEKPEDVKNHDSSVCSFSPNCIFMPRSPSDAPADDWLDPLLSEAPEGVKRGGSFRRQQKSVINDVSVNLLLLEIYWSSL